MLESATGERPLMADPDGLEAALAAARTHLLAAQQPGGYWWGGVEGSCGPAAWYILLVRFLALDEPLGEVVRYVLFGQSDDGSWSRYPGGPGDLSLTLESYLALSLAGMELDAPPLAAARAFIRENGGPGAASLLTRVWLALFGQMEWRALPAIPPELTFLPSGFPFGLHGFPAWTRASLVPLSVLWARRPLRALPEAALDDLYRDPQDRRRPAHGGPQELFSWRSFFLRADRWLRRLERLPAKAWRPAALGRAERWLLERQETDGSWAGSFAPTAWSLVALTALGRPPDDPAVRRGLSALRDEFLMKTSAGVTVQPVLQPAADTALAVLALRAAGLAGDDPALLAAGRWLLEAQSFQQGDWQAAAPATQPGGWAAGFAPDHYPDVGVTAAVMSALLALDLPPDESRPALERGLRWLLGMQGKDGGWGALDRRAGRRVLAEWPFLEFAAPFGRSSVDDTAAVVEMLIAGGRGREFEPVARALAFLAGAQEPDGCWPGERGVNYLYGTYRAVAALGPSGGPRAADCVAQAARWLEGHQSAAGCWGETVASYADTTLRGLGPPTATQTAWGLQGLVAAGRVEGDAARKAAAALVQSQSPDGSWEECAFTARTTGGTPVRDRLWRTAWPLLALARYRQALAEARAAGQG